MNAHDGSFKEASWTRDPVKYLPVSQTEAWRILLDYCEQQGIQLKDIEQLSFILTYRGSSPYYPEWRISIEELGEEFYINQEGAVHHP